MASQVPGVRWRVVRSLFELLYRNSLLYWLASTVPFAGQWRRWQRLVIPRLVGKHVLEIGCGIGTLLVDMAQAGYSCAAQERSSQMLAATQARLRRHGLLGRVVLQQGVAQELPYTAASFDSVVSTFPSDYIFDPRTQGEIARVLALHGRLIIVLGATLLPANFLLLPLVALQSLVYGSRGHRAQIPSPSELEGELSVLGPRGQVLLQGLAAAGLLAHIEPVTGPFWVAYVCVAEKS